MSRKIDAFKAVVPVVADRAEGSFLGSGFFVGPNCVVLTAKHVIDAHEGPVGVVTRDNVFRKCTVQRTDQAADLAILTLDELTTREEWFSIRTAMPLDTSRFVSSIEFSTTTSPTNPRFHPALRIGNVTRSVTVDVMGVTGRNLWELSFPALQGASGAPVFDQHSGVVIGMLISNADYEARPSQVYRYEEVGRCVEERKYHVPQGLAKQSREIARLLNDWGGAGDYLDDGY
jgi:hypothetical protein